MKQNREYEIAWQGLKSGISKYSFQIEKDFIDQFNDEGTDIIDIEANVGLSFDKQPNFFMLHFDIDGYVTTVCDRCGDNCKLKLWDEFDLLIKLVSEETSDEDEDADVVYIPRNETIINISKWIYEFLMLSIPLQKVHANDGSQENSCNPEALKLLDKLSGNESRPNAIWKGLEKLKKEKSNKNKN